MENTIATGTFLRNGGNRFYQVITFNENIVTLEEYNGYGATGRIRTLNRHTFNGLYRLKNYAITRFAYNAETDRWEEKTDRVLERMISARRFQVRQY